MEHYIITRRVDNQQEYLGPTRTGDMWRQQPDTAIRFQTKEEANQYRHYNYPNDPAVRVQKMDGERGV